MSTPEPADDMVTREHRVDNGDGYQLSMFQTYRPDKLDPKRRPVLIVPGYGMNSFIFSYHPRGLSLEGFLGEQGFEVWRVDLRGQGRTIRDGGREDYGLEDLAVTDLGAAMRGVLAKTKTDADRVDLIGCSLGGTIMFIHAALDEAHRVGSMVAVGSPVRWVKIHPVLKLAFRSPRVVGLIRVRGTRRLLRLAVPYILKRIPWVLSVYMNPEICDMDALTEMAKTVEDPNRHVNRQIAKWINQRDLVLRGVNVSEEIERIDRPLMCILANRDGIVPRETAIFPFHRMGARSRQLLEVGTEEIGMAHADLFISNEAHERVFSPLARWLEEQNDS